MIESIDAFLRYYEGIHQRTLRDIGALPGEADGWRPPAAVLEQAWSINTLVAHIAATRLFFASAYRGEGWVVPLELDARSRHDWLPVIEQSWDALQRRLEGTADGWLRRRVPLLDSPAEISGWRVLMLMVEHEAHHRSQIDAYAGLNGWPVPDLFGRSWEQVQAGA